MAVPTATSHAMRMDRKYGRVRHIYDATRKYFLFGRDRALERLRRCGASAILEIGCGTGRNLIRLARDNPSASIYGLDISGEMLKTAAARTRGQASIRLAHGDACSFDPRDVFGARETDAVLMSFSLSMVPDPRAAIMCAMRSLAPGGTLVIVDFGDFRGFGRLGPMAIRALSAADAPPVPDLEGLLRECAGDDGRFEIEAQMRLRGYYAIATLNRRG